jgi:hypothetical protein
VSRLQFLFACFLPGFFFWVVSQWLLGEDLLNRAGQLLFIGMVILQYRLTRHEKRGSVILHGAGIYLYGVYLLPPGIPGLILWTLLSLLLFLPGSLFIGYPYRHPLILLILMGGLAGLASGLKGPHAFWIFSEAAPFEKMPFLSLIPLAYMVWRESGHFLEIAGVVAGLAAFLSLSGRTDQFFPVLAGSWISLVILYFSLPFRSRYPGYIRPISAGVFFFFLLSAVGGFSFWFRFDTASIIWPSAACLVLQDWLSAPLNRFFRRAMV